MRMKRERKRRGTQTQQPSNLPCIPPFQPHNMLYACSFASAPPLFHLTTNPSRKTTRPAPRCWKQSISGRKCDLLTLRGIAVFLLLFMSSSASPQTPYHQQQLDLRQPRATPTKAFHYRQQRQRQFQQAHPHYWNLPL